MKVAFYTLGCRLNQLETEALASSFRGQGFFIVDWEEQAGIYIINTCTVTSKSEQKARRMVRKISRENPEVPVIVTGCYAQMERGSILDLGDNVVVVPLDDKDIIQDLAVYLSSQDSSTWLNASAHWMEEHLGLQGDKDKRFRFNPREFSFHSRAYLKVQDGCDNQCAYC
nr:tRNA (N(6)-L-threonylcarbamoyladenosine(37)-C(2))-methylthiotransferase MtaB [Spirochaetaceae bacterium]